MPDQRRRGADAVETFALDNQSFDTAADSVAKKAKCHKSTANRKKGGNILPSKRNNEHCVECYSRNRLLSWFKQFVRGVTFKKSIDQLDEQPYLKDNGFSRLRVKRADLGDRWVKARLCDIADIKKRQHLLKVLNFYSNGFQKKTLNFTSEPAS